MTVVKGGNRRHELHGVVPFIARRTATHITVALIPCVQGQMKGFLARMCANLVRDQERPLFLDGGEPIIPTTNEKGKMYVTYNVTTQNFELALRFDNYVVQQTIPERAYV